MKNYKKNIKNWMKNSLHLKKNKKILQFKWLKMNLLKNNLKSTNINKIMKNYSK
jgi:hypothetical protein